VGLYTPLEDLEHRIVKLEHKLAGLEVTLGDEGALNYGYGERRVPDGPPHAITGFAYGAHSDLFLWYRMLQLQKPTDQTATLASVESRLARLSKLDSMPPDLPAAVLALERTMAGLKLGLDRPDKWIDYTRPFRATPHRVPARGANVLTGVMYGHRSDDVAMFFGTLAIEKVPDTTTRPKKDPLEVRVAALEAAFEGLTIDLGDTEHPAAWSWSSEGGGSDGARITTSGVLTAMNWGRWLVYRVPRLVRG
jgi:hypothetical protein